ncbi:metallophosphoesterase domain-containing protein 1-like, partial [Hemiscyllium ocellatum]|uniref:metallophosphoesterase domain-containing protein 1-like n=1 Tax=Hemiscyllium ocellatum TaxID=170820 RepID=UPI002965D830
MDPRPLSPEYLRLRRDPHRRLRLEELPPGSPPSPGYVRVVCISDTHLRTKQRSLPQGDILIHAGDFTQTGHRSEILAFRN